jgi:hypothetical protein
MAAPGGSRLRRNVSSEPPPKLSFGSSVFWWCADRQGRAGRSASARSQTHRPTGCSARKPPQGSAGRPGRLPPPPPSAGSPTFSLMRVAGRESRGVPSGPMTYFTRGRMFHMWLSCGGTLAALSRPDLNNSLSRSFGIASKREGPDGERQSACGRNWAMAFGELLETR